MYKTPENCTKAVEQVAGVENSLELNDFSKNRR